MTFTKEYLLSLEDHAVLGQPIYLLVVCIIAAVVITLFGLSLQMIIGDSEFHQVEHQIDIILTEASTMFEYADEGSQALVNVDFPKSLRFIVFGSLPRNSTTEPMNLTLDENTSNNYYFVMNDGTLHVFHSNVRFSNQNTTQILILHPGRFTLTMELVTTEGKPYVTMY
jgi:hypothetical protein